MLRSSVWPTRARFGDAKELIYPTVQWKSGKVSRLPLFNLPKEMLSIVTPEDMDYETDGGNEESGVPDGQEPLEVVKRPSK